MKSVSLRKRKIGRGRTSLYLDIYLDGERFTESLGLYLVEEKTREDRYRNEDTITIAQGIQRKRERSLIGGSKYCEIDTPFFSYVEERAKPNWKAGLLPHLRMYETRENISFRDITPEWVRGFREYLDTCTTLARAAVKHREDIHRLAPMTKVSHFMHLCALLNKAVEDGIIEKSPAKGIKNFKKTDSTRMYLTREELKRLIKTPCNNTIVRRTFLFSCLTGLRCSDIVRLDWSDVHKTERGTRIIFRQQKTHYVEYLDINPQAVELMGERGEGKVFKEFTNPTHASLVVQRWCKRAGIDKHITFHSARHTFAVMMLDLGVDIYTVSKLLGHRELATTQIYAKVLDKNKVAAVKKIPKFL